MVTESEGHRPVMPQLPIGRTREVKMKDKWESKTRTLNKLTEYQLNDYDSVSDRGLVAVVSRNHLQDNSEGCPTSYTKIRKRVPPRSQRLRKHEF
jgi:hypothetical protein